MANQDAKITRFDRYYAALAKSKEENKRKRHAKELRYKKRYNKKYKEMKV